MKTRSLERAPRVLVPRIDATTLLGALLVLSTLAAVLGQASGRISTPRALLLLLSPIVGIAAILRPAWLVLLLAAIPTGLLAVVPTRGMVLLLAGALVAQLLIRGRLSLGRASGMVPLLVLAVAAYLFTADVDAGAALTARGFLNVFSYLILLGLMTYNVTLFGDLEVGDLINAFIIGAVIVVILERVGAIGLVQGGGGEASIASLGRNVAYVAAMGFSLSFTRLLLPDAGAGGQHRGLYALLAAVFAIVVAQEFVRAAWLSCVIVVFLVSMWGHKRRYWVILAFVTVLVATIPVVTERVLPGYEEGIERAIASGEFATGRLDLWDILWPEVTEGLPAGHGYGYTFTLSPESLFGFETFVVEGGGDSFVYPHNDFIFWTLELGLLGLVAMVVFWIHLAGVFRWLTKHGPPPARRGAYALSGIFVTAFVVQLVDNSFAIRAVGGWLFIAAGSVFGLAAAARKSESLAGNAPARASVVRSGLT